MNKPSLKYKGLTITSYATLYPQKLAYGVTGKISGIQIGMGGCLNQIYSSATVFCATEDEAHRQFFEAAKKYIDEYGLGEE